MAQTIHRMFDSNERANQAAQALRNHRFDRFDDVFVFAGHGPTGTELSIEDIVAAMMKACILKSTALILAQGVNRGGTLVTVYAAFGTAASAIDVLDQFGPIESGLVEPKDDFQAWDDAAPLSSVLHIPTHLPDSATFSKFWNVSPLAKSGGTTSSALGLPEISNSKGPFTGSFPLPLLSSNPTPLSSMLGLPVLKRAQADKR